MRNEEIAKRIIAIRHSFRMNRQEFAKFLDITPQYLGIIERGLGCLSVEKVIWLAQKANVTTDYILLGKDCVIDDKTIATLANIKQDDLNDYYSIISQIIELIKMKK